MNKLRPSERLLRLLALLLCLLLYAGGGSVGYFWGSGLFEENRTSVHIHAVNLNFAQMELVAAQEPPPQEPEPLPPEDVDVVLEEIIEEPEPEPVEADALMSQEASSADEEVTADALSDWVLEQIQKEKYYPPSAKRAGYEGIFDLLVIIEADGTISEASIIYGRGHPLLRRSLEKMLGTLVGRNFGRPLGQTVEMPVEFEFELE